MIEFVSCGATFTTFYNSNPKMYWSEALRENFDTRGARAMFQLRTLSDM